MSHPDAYRNWKNSYNQQQRPKYPPPTNVYSRPSTPLPPRSPYPRVASSPRPPPVDHFSPWSNVSMLTPSPRNNTHNAYTRSSVYRPSAPSSGGDHRRGQYTPRQPQPRGHLEPSTQSQASYHRQQSSQEDLNTILRRLFLQKNIDITNSVKLGAGRYSKVITARQYENAESGTYRKIAIKVINKEKVTTDFRDKFLPREIDCWRQLRHPNLVRILGHYEAMKYVFLSMEYGQKGDLLAYVQKYGAVAEGQARVWMQMIISGVGYMHSCRMAHRDLKLENCILFDGGIVKVADFGFARKVGANPSTTYCGSKSYSSPEILMGHPYSPYKADVWSIGVIGFIIVTDTMPFRENMHNFKIVENQKNRAYNYPEKLEISSACCRSLDEMMTFDAQLRPTIADCHRLPFFYVADARIR